jgi:hypothetical protein
MTRALSLCAFLLSALTLAACNDVPIGGDGSKSHRDAGADVTPADLAPDVLADLAPDVLADLSSDIRPYQAPDVLADLAPDTATCTGANPAAQKCRNTSDQCIPSSCSCSADGFWHCTADCPVNVPLCADAGTPDLAPDAATCTGANPAAQKCRNTSDQCIPSSCSCSADGFWHCTADCPVNVPLCADAGTPDLASDVARDAYVYPNDEQSCLKATNVPVCDIFPPYAVVTSAAGGPLLAKVEVTAGPCSASACASECDSIGVSAMDGTPAGTTCNLLVTSTDGRSQSITLTVVATSASGYTCCGYPLDGHGMWVALNSLNFSPSPIVVDFTGDGGAGTVDVDATKDVGADQSTTLDLAGDTGPNPCAQCGANEVCVQSFDGVCHLGTITCRTVSETCRNKLSAMSTKACYSIPECESEFCSSPFRCIYSTPCGTEVPEAAIYCYGP